MLRAKRRRTRTHDINGNPIFNTMNSTPLQSAYVNINNNQKQLQDCKCTSCGNPNSGCTCIPLNPNAPFKQRKYCNDKIIRNPIPGYRKQQVFCNPREKDIIEEYNRLVKNGLIEIKFDSYAINWSMDGGCIVSQIKSINLNVFNGIYKIKDQGATITYQRDDSLVNALGPGRFTLQYSQNKWYFEVDITQNDQCPTGRMCLILKLCTSNGTLNILSLNDTSIKWKIESLTYPFSSTPPHLKPSIDTSFNNKLTVKYDKIHKRGSKIIQRIIENRPPKDPRNIVYKDNYAKTCGTFRKDNVIGVDDKGNLIVNNSKSESKDANLCGYSQVKKTTQNRNGWVNDKYNYSSKQYLERRCRTFGNLGFNFLSNKSIKGSKNSEFLTGCSNARVHSNSKYNQGNKDCSGECDLSCNNILGLDCTVMNCSQQMDNFGNISCAKKGYTICEATNNNCKAVYKRSNPRFSTQGAVSGGSRINRLKYQTKIKAQSTRYQVNGNDGTNKTSAVNTNLGPQSFDDHINSVNGFGGASNGTYPVSLYRNTFPTYKANLSGACVGKSLTFNGLPQRCKMPEEKPSCRALQTLPQKCNFRCNTKYNCKANK
jgi:hypothetical protein